MNIHEFQGKEILSRYGVPVPEGLVASTPEEAAAAARKLTGPWVIKAQIHAGGRGKGGGIAVVDDIAEVKKAAARILGKALVTHQTGPEGKLVRRVLVERACKISRELYLGVVVDRARARTVVMASPEGGVEIEEVARRWPEKILTEVAAPGLGFLPFQARRLALSLGLDKSQINAGIKCILGLYQAFLENDCSLAEINPLVVTEEGKLLALDAKLNFDASGLYRHQEIAGLRDHDEEDPRELEASKYGLSYIGLSGNIGCLVNGAGLAMSTMDIIKLYGGEPANFLDVGGAVTVEGVTEGFKLILGDEKVQGVLVNIFGGIVHCDVIAQGIITAARELKIGGPLVVRLEGTNVEEGRRLLAESGLNISRADSMKQAAEMIVAAVK